MNPTIPQHLVQAIEVDTSALYDSLWIMDFDQPCLLSGAYNYVTCAFFNFKTLTVGHCVWQAFLSDLSKIRYVGPMKDFTQLLPGKSVYIPAFSKTCFVHTWGAMVQLVEQTEGVPVCTFMTYQDLQKNAVPVKTLNDFLEDKNIPLRSGLDRILEGHL